MSVQLSFGADKNGHGNVTRAICSVCSMQIIYHQWKLCLSLSERHIVCQKLWIAKTAYINVDICYSIILCLSLSLSVCVASIYLELWNIVAWFHQERAIWLLEISLWGACIFHFVFYIYVSPSWCVSFARIFNSNLWSLHNSQFNLSLWFRLLDIYQSCCAIWTDRFIIPLLLMVFFLHFDCTPLLCNRLPFDIESMPNNTVIETHLKISREKKREKKKLFRIQLQAALLGKKSWKIMSVINNDQQWNIFTVKPISNGYR